MEPPPFFLGGADVRPEAGCRPPWPQRSALRRAALVAVLLCPVFLMHGRGLAEGCIAATDLLFLAGSWRARAWGWVRTPWFGIGLAWWGWLVLCSVPFLPEMGSGGLHSLLEAVLTLRLLLFVAALEHFVLVEARHRRWLERLLRLAALYIALQCLLQAATGRNLFGYPRYGDGSLTGPYRDPRAGPPYSRLLFPALLPTVAGLLARGRWVLGAALALAGVAVAVLIGQRMPLLLVGLGLVVSALLLPRLRPIALGCAVLAPALVALTLWASPPTYHKLVTVFSQQMEHLPQSTYGRIWQRALVIVEADPLTGRGFDGFRTGCTLPRFFHGWNGGDGGGAAICVQHPHNHYLQAATDSGLPGLALFCALVLAWLAALGRGLWRDPDPLRVGLFVAALIQEWPLASASSYTSMPLSGWFFLMLGLGMAEARAYMERRSGQGGMTWATARREPGRSR